VNDVLHVRVWTVLSLVIDVSILFAVRCYTVVQCVLRVHQHPYDASNAVRLSICSICVRLSNMQQMHDL